MTIVLKMTLIFRFDPDVKSTAELDTIQMTTVYENINNFTANSFAVSVVWPDKVDKK